MESENKNFISIGYFGVIRCNHSLQLLKKIVDQANGKIQLYIRGIFQEHLGLMKDELLESKYVEFGGSFKSPDELPEMYKSVDLTWTAIYHFKPNIMWSRTNRYYQACFFKRPMITQIGTPDAAEVQKFNIGCSIDLTSQLESLEKIMNIRGSQIRTWKENMIHLPKDVYILTNEHKDLIRKVNA